MSKNITIVSFFPDTGHVIPLLRLASLLKRNECNVTVILPDECRKLSEDFMIPAKFFGEVAAHTDKNIYSYLSKKSIFYNAFTDYYDIRLAYIFPIYEAVIENMHNIKNLLMQEKFDLLIADDHVFRDAYLQLARYFQTNIVYHISGGNFFGDYSYSTFVRYYGVIKMLYPFQLLVTHIGNFITDRFHKKIEKKFDFLEGSLKKSLEKHFRTQNSREILKTLISTGLPYLDKVNVHRNYSEISEFSLFPPLAIDSKQPIDKGLMDWINVGDDLPVIYVGVGTNIRGNKNLLKAILEGLAGVKARVIWAAPADQIALINKIGVPHNVRLEEFVPQYKILNLEKVRCFITHAGAGGVQEGLITGTPMLCIPFMFDQPYNACLVENLKAGIKLWKRQVNPKAIRNAVNHLLQDDNYRQSCMKIKQELGGNQGEERLIGFLKKQLG